MTIEQADNIVIIWGKYLEYCSKIVFIFGASIPESFLPFPKKILLEALNIMAKHYTNLGNVRGVTIIQETASELIRYVDDEEALVNSAEDFCNPEWRKAFIPSLKNMQKEWIKTQKGFDESI